MNKLLRKLNDISKITRRAAFSDMEHQIKKYKYGSDAFMQILESRYSCHAFTHHPVSDSKLQMILDAGRMAHRWWNPAVENQASDRAFRIGQKKDVMVHKIVARGTIEEKIDQMIESKKELASNVIGEGSEKWITELSNEELVSLLKLD